MSGGTGRPLGLCRLTGCNADCPEFLMNSLISSSVIYVDVN